MEKCFNGLRLNVLLIKNKTYNKLKILNKLTLNKGRSIYKSKNKPHSISDEPLNWIKNKENPSIHYTILQELPLEKCLKFVRCVKFVVHDANCATVRYLIRRLKEHKRSDPVGTTLRIVVSSYQLKTCQFCVLRHFQNFI